MKTRNTFILLALAAAFFAYLFFYESKQPGTQLASLINANILSFNPDTIDGILIKNNESEIRLHRINGFWQLEFPVTDRADLKAVGELLVTTAILPKVDTLHGDSKDFDPTDSKLSLKLSGPGAPPEIFIGKETAVEGCIYIKLAGSKTLYATGDSLKKIVQKKSDDFRDHRLTDINPPLVNRIAIKTVAGEIELQKQINHWEIIKPIRTRADEQKTTDLIMRIIGARIHEFIPEKEANAAITGLAEPRGIITVDTEDRDKPTLIQIGQPDGHDQVYAHLSARDAVLLLSSTVAHLLDLRPNDLRDTHLFLMNLDLVDRITITPADKTKFILSRKIEDWMIGDRPVDSNEMKRFSKMIQEQEVVAFITDVASDLAKFGLDQPLLKLTFSSVASENTAETEAGERPISTLLFGAIEGANVYAMIEGEPFVVAVDKSILNSILIDPVQWRDLSIFKLRSTDIVSIQLEREGRPPVSFVRDSAAGWKSTKGETVINPIPVQSLCNTLASLRAVRRTGSNTSGLGFDQPAITLSFSTADKMNYRLVVGNLALGSMWNAMTTSENGAFILSRPDVETLQADFN